jgi:hypothetical protein
MAKQTFSVGQVLTAAQMTSLQETAMGGGAASAKTANYVLVAADAGTTISMTSTSATTITVNTGLFAAGDTVFIQNLGSGTCTITAGTATVNTAGSLILPQYDAGILYFVSASSAIFYDYIQAGATTPTFVGASVSFDANKSIANATTTTLTFDVELIDTNAFHDNSTNTSRLTIPSGYNGKYLITTQLFPIENSTGRREVRFIKNGSVLYGWNMNGYGTMEMINFAAFMNLVAGDYIEMSFRQSSGGSLTLYGSNTSTGVGDPGFFNIQYLGA